MKISNIRIEICDDKAYLKTDFDCGFSETDQLWFSVDKKYADWLCADIYDAFMVEAVYLGMYYGENVEIEGLVSKKLHHNLLRYIMPVIKTMNPDFHDIEIHCKGFGFSPKSEANIIGTGFSGGVDSFGTLTDNYFEEDDPEYKINTLFFFNVGQYKGTNQEERTSKALEHYNNSLLFSEEVGLPFIFMDSNMFDVYLPQWEYDAGPMCRISSILAFQRGLRRYYVSGSNHYLQQNSSKDKHLDDVTDEFIYSMLSPDGLEIVLDGNQHYRSEKLIKIVDSPLAQKHLNVCVNSDIDVLKEKNCSTCHKCFRTLIVLEALGKLQQFSHVFDLQKYKKVRGYYLNRAVLDYGKAAFATENINLLRKAGIYIPGKLRAHLGVLPLDVKVKLYRLLHASNK